MRLAAAIVVVVVAAQRTQNVRVVKTPEQDAETAYTLATCMITATSATKEVTKQHNNALTEGSFLTCCFHPIRRCCCCTEHTTSQETIAINLQGQSSCVPRLAMVMIWTDVKEATHAQHDFLTHSEKRSSLVVVVVVAAAIVVVPVVVAISIIVAAVPAVVVASPPGEPERKTGYLSNQTPPLTVMVIPYPIQLLVHDQHERVLICSITALLLFTMNRVQIKEYSCRLLLTTRSWSQPWAAEPLCCCR